MSVLIKKINIPEFLEESKKTINTKNVNINKFLKENKDVISQHNKVQK